MANVAETRRSNVIFRTKFVSITLRGQNMELIKVGDYDIRGGRPSGACGYLYAQVFVTFSCSGLCES